MLDQATRLREIAEQYCERPRSSKPHIVTVTSGKGGVGKSTIALNLAVRLAELGNRTLIFDADENLASIDIMMDTSPTLRLGNILRGENDLEQVIYSPLKNLCILPGNSGECGYPKMTLEQQNALLNDIAELDDRFDYLVIDTPAGIGEKIVNLAVHSHETIIVTTPEPTAVLDAYAMIKLITLADEHVPVSLIVNNERTSGQAKETASKLQLAVARFLNRTVSYLGSIPYDPHVATAILHQSPLLKEFPMSSASLSLHILAERFVEQAAHRQLRRFQTA